MSSRIETNDPVDTAKSRCKVAVIKCKQMEVGRNIIKFGPCPDVTLHLLAKVFASYYKEFSFTELRTCL